MSVFKELEENLEDCSVDYFLISTRENQFLLIFLDQLDAMKGALNEKKRVTSDRHYHLYESLASCYNSSHVSITTLPTRCS